MKKIELYFRSLLLNLIHFHSFRKRVLFGKNVNIIGNVSLSDHITLDDNVEVRNLTREELTIGSYTSVNRNTVIRGKVTIGEHVSIAPNCMIIGTSHRFDNKTQLIQEQGFTIAGVLIESDVWIGANCVVLDGVTIGRGSVIGAGSVVTKSIPPMSVAFGNPCRVRRER